MDKFEKGDQKYKNKSLKEIAECQEKEFEDGLVEEVYTYIELSSDEEWKIDRVGRDEVILSY